MRDQSGMCPLSPVTRTPRVAPRGWLAGLRMIACTAVAGAWAAAAASGSEPAPDSRLVVPREAAIAAARDLVRQAYEEKFAAAEQGKPGDLVTVLTEAADKTDLPERKYAMLTEAERVATAAGDMGQTIELVLKRTALFRLDPLTESLTAVSRALEANRKTRPQLLGGVIDQSLRLATAAMAADRLEDAISAADMAGDAAKAVTLAAKPARKAVTDRRLIDTATNATKAAESMTRGIRRRIKARDEMRAAARILDTTPNDAAANAIVGGYECFVLGDWEHGLPRLARSDAGDLQRIATEELRVRAEEPGSTKHLFSLAGRWWDAAETTGIDAETAEAIRAHAAGIYASIAAGLADPLDLEIAKKRSRAAKAPPDGTPAGSDRRRSMYPARSDATLRAELIKTGGGTVESEAAVDAALKWMLDHQLDDGGWSFEFRDCPRCNGQCGDSGNRRQDRCAATALALLPFLGRGYTHRDGPFRQELERGLGFLATLARQGAGNAGKAGGGNAYSQGIAAIALSEAYGITRDTRLRDPARAALQFIMEAQDPRGGGWGYSPKTSGDTSISGWQLVALRIGSDAGLPVNAAVVANLGRFLDSVQDDGGAAYGYRTPSKAPGTSAIGLLCRLHMGWKTDHPAIDRGVAAIAERGPSSDIYFDFYANQLLYRVGGPSWQAWNAKLRDSLVQSQAKSGHQAGSWFESFEGGHGGHMGGRLYCTSLATLILETYYRNAAE